MGRCAVPRCVGHGSVVYYDREVCDRCWNKYMADNQPPMKLKEVLGVRADEEPKGIGASFVKEEKKKETKSKLQRLLTRMKETRDGHG